MVQWKVVAKKPKKTKNLNVSDFPPSLTGNKPNKKEALKLQKALRVHYYSVQIAPVGSEKAFRLLAEDRTITYFI